MKYRSIFLCLFIVNLFWSCDSEPARQPNVILIMTDDQGYGDLACHGNPWIKTPELDKLHSQSVRFTDFHVGTTCAPTRSGLLTGRNCNEVGVWHTIIGRNFLREGEVTVADILGENGYTTGIFGKWHLGDNYPYLPENRGFDVSVIHGGGGVGQTPDYWNNDYFDDTYFRNGRPEKFEGYCTDIWFNEALNFIESKKDNPFFCYIAPNAPHGPFHVPQKYIDMYSDNPDIVNPNFYGMITNIDENLGLLRSKLAEWDIEDNTILIFLTDNGTSSGISLDKSGFPKKGYNAGMRGKKGSAYEGGHRVPLFVYWPGGGINKPVDVDYITSYTDVLPTILDLCDINYDANLPFEGESLVALLENPEDSWKTRTLFTDTQRKEFLVKWKDASIMTDEYRLIRGKELYDHRRDPGQTTDISDQHPEVVALLRTEYEQWWKRVSKDSSRINPIPVGFNDEAVTLTCHDIHADDGKSPAWNQTHVRKNQNPNGFWIIDVKVPGKYTIEMRRYPIESGLGFAAVALEGDHIDGGKPYPEGIPIHVDRAILNLGDDEMEQQIQQSAESAIFNIDLETGEQMIRATLIDEKNIKVGAYYVYITKSS